MAARSPGSWVRFSRSPWRCSRSGSDFATRTTRRSSDVKFLVCLKQVPDSTVRVKVAPDGKSVATEGITWSISPYDEYAIELALEHKDGDPSTTVSVVTVGPARARDALRQALAMGCDDATLVTKIGRAH